MIVDGGMQVDLLDDGRHIQIDGLMRKVSNPAWRLLSAFEEDWPNPLTTWELADTLGIRVKIVPKYVHYARRTLNMAGIRISYDHHRGYEPVGLEDIRHATGADDRIAVGDGMTTSEMKRACDAHLADLRASGMTAWPSMQA